MAHQIISTFSALLPKEPEQEIAVLCEMESWCAERLRAIAAAAGADPPRKPGDARRLQVAVLSQAGKSESDIKTALGIPVSAVKAYMMDVEYHVHRTK